MICIKKNYLITLASILLSVYILSPSKLYAEEAQDLFRKASARIKNSDYDSAIKDLERVEKENPQDVGVACNLAVAYAYKGETDKAIGKIEKVIDKEPLPSRAILFYNLGNLYRVKRYQKEAEGNYNKALAILPYFAQPYLGLGLLHLQKGERAKAQECFSKANSMDSFMPDMSPPVEKKQTIGYTKVAIAEKNAPPVLYLYHSPGWYISLAIDYMEKNDLDNARKEIEKATQVLDKDSPLEADKFALSEVYLYMGVTYTKEKNFDRALEEFQKARDIDPSHLGAITNIGGIYFIKGDFTTAKKYCEMALNIDPNFYPAQILKEALNSQEAK